MKRMASTFSARLLTLMALMLAPMPAAAQDAARGASLLAEARKAVGGEDRLRAVKTLQVRGDFKRTAGQNTVEGELDLRLEPPSRLRRDEDTSLPGGGPAIIRTEVLNGTDAWDENTGGGGNFGFRGGGGGRGDFGGFGGGRAGNVPGDAGAGRGRGPVDPEQLRQLQVRARQADLDRFMLSMLLASDAPVAWVGTAQSPDGQADVLEFTPAGGTPTRLFLDVATHVPLMITWQGVAPQAAGRRGGAGRGGDPPPGDQPAPPPPPQRPQAAMQRLTLGDYKVVGGIRFPHTITRGVNDQTIEEWTVDSYRVNPSFRSDTFSK